MIRSLAPAVAGLLLLALATTAGAAPPVRLAVLPVQVHSLDQQDYLREGIGDMLTTRLARSPGLTVVAVDDPAQATSSSDAARESARAVGASYVLFGSFTRFGEGASLDLKCVRVDGEGEADPRSIFVQAGTLGEIIPRLDELSEKVALHVTSGGGGALPPVAAGPSPDGAPAPAPSSDVEALRRRVERLEQALYGPTAGAPPEEETLGEP